MAETEWSAAAMRNRYRFFARSALHQDMRCWAQKCSQKAPTGNQTAREWSFEEITAVRLGVVADMPLRCPVSA